MTDAAVAVAGAWTTDPSRLPDELSSTFRAVMGWGGVAVWDESVDIVDLTREFAAAHRPGVLRPVLPLPHRHARGRRHPRGDLRGQGHRGAARARARAQPARRRGLALRPRPHRRLRGARVARAALRPASPPPSPAGQPIPRGVYASTVVAPCMAACPAGVDIPAYVEQLRIDEVERSADAVRRRCPMPGTIGRVCVRPCEDACRRGSVDEPVAIRTLKRFVADSEADVIACPMPGHPRVAIIGAGPAGLACAYYLGLEGSSAPSSRRCRRPAAWPPSASPTTACRATSCAPRSSASSRSASRSSTTSASVSTRPWSSSSSRASRQCSSPSAPTSRRAWAVRARTPATRAYMPGVEFLREIAFGNVPLTGRRSWSSAAATWPWTASAPPGASASTTSSCCTAAPRRRCPPTRSRSSRPRRRASSSSPWSRRTRIVAEDGKVVGLECRRMQLGEPDSSGRRRPEPVEGSEFVIPCDCIVPAIGQVCGVDQLVPSHIEVSKWKTLEVDPLTMQSADPRVFGGGDCSPRRAASSRPSPPAAAPRRPSASPAGQAGRVAARGPARARHARGHPHRGSDPDRRSAEYREAAAARRAAGGPHPVLRRGRGAGGAADARREAERCLRCYRIAVAVV